MMYGHQTITLNVGTIPATTTLPSSSEFLFLVIHSLALNYMHYFRYSWDDSFNMTSLIQALDVFNQKEVSVYFPNSVPETGMREYAVVYTLF